MAKPEILKTWAKMREKRWFRWSTDALIFIGILAAVAAIQTADHVDSGQAAPPLHLATLSGEEVDLATLQKPAVVFFWAPWCGVCKADAHNIDAVAEAVGDNAHVFSVALSYQSLDDVKNFVAENAVSSPVLLGDRAVSETWRVDAFPTIYIVDEDGKIAHSMVGYTTELGLRLRLASMGVF